jgi:ABC-type multidrug transport system fused ATPase/permease subunit
LFEREPTLVRLAPDDATPLPGGALSAELRGVTFAYEDDDPVLHGVDLDVPAGSRLGLIGRSGAGKTTIARLLVRLHDPTAGGVRLGGVDLRAVSVADLRRRTTVVTQDVQLFPASVRDNLTLFRPDAVADGELRDLLVDLGLGPWLAALPHGLDTELGAAVGLSAGEAQLIALSRAFLADPGLVVLDEPSSRLDPATDVAVERAIETLLEGRTAVVIAHRLGSLDRVDDIAVVDRGRVVEHGSRDALADDPASRFGSLLVASRAGRST